MCILCIYISIYVQTRRWLKEANHSIRYLSKKKKMRVAMNDHLVVAIFTVLVPVILITFGNNDRNNYDGNGEVLIIPPKLELIADLSHGNTDITCPYIVK